ncbi:hypothetical protein EMIHUDRAFT_440656 [Emiliania huxleyi CCMP1516]|uniref:Xaa-Pro dipeptidyl-peptidase C-terminal domain-containing protein n=2 Tax=Emiliania huxleyi TaxID=2903 RepID=A0A0D3KKP1_EMIH1|nr:hypothetical protein EMIHUDRAFT_440656 [Emiliania huxleyi CCMP1516]EOD36326.1 hypothetical protein EMIHUDRAFT_440656 [Emiliania huxleyi CCMP1516]|eukprot:XP_005788755.1 hypothetical protein EMIHUDRAFT_440656 [Emiliania huxleyi CCMP1516]
MITHSTRSRRWPIPLTLVATTLFAALTLVGRRPSSEGIDSLATAFDDSTMAATLTAEQKLVDFQVSADETEEAVNSQIGTAGAQAGSLSLPASSEVLPAPLEHVRQSVADGVGEASTRFGGEVGKAGRFASSRVTESLLGLAQAGGLGDLKPGGLSVEWEELAISGVGGARLKAVVAYPKAGAAEATRRFPVVVLCNSWVMNWWEYAVKQQEWAAAGYVVLMYVARGWWESEGEVTAAGPLEVDDARRVLDTVETRAADWHADPSRIATAGVSYGGGLAVLTAAADSRVTAAVSLSGWGNINRALAGQGAPNLFWYEVWTARSSSRGNRSEEVVGWCRTRSPEAHLQDLCGGGRATPVLLSNNAEDRLFAPDAALLYRQALHGAGCRVETMIHEGIHAMAELPGMLGFSDAVATSSPLWSRVLAFLDANLKPGAAPPPPPPPALSFQLRQPEASVFKNYVPVYLDFDSWPSPRVQPSSYRLRGDALAPPQARDVAAPSPPPKAEECTRRLAYGPDTGFSGGAPLHTALGRGVAREVSRNVPPRLSPPQVPLLSPFVSAAAGVQIKSYRRAINSSSAALFVAPPQAAPLRVCGIPNATFHASSSMDRFQLAARVFSMAPNGELELLSFGARDVWHRGPDPPCLRPDGITDERGTPRGLVGPPRRYLRPDDVRDNWDVPAGGAGEVVVRMAALCTDVPAGNAVALGLSLHDPTRAAANSDVALRVDVGCCGASALWLPVVGASGGAAL